MKELVEYIAKSLVDQPEAVVVTEEHSPGRTVLSLKVAQADMGKVIGKQGRIAQAIRTLLKVAATQSAASAPQPVLVIGSVEDAEKSHAFTTGAAAREEEDAEDGDPDR
ncbi:MAG: KH domain-containing protein [Chloroflexi bacterium]|nr:KH domain-containing protein [Chloroflexota bacterium]